MDTTKYLEFASNILKTNFNNLQLLITAFTHRSYVNEHKKTAREHNGDYRDWETDRKSTRLNSSHSAKSRMPSSA